MAGHLFLTTDAVGGVWPYSLALADALRPFGYRVTLVTLGPPPAEAQRGEAMAIPGLELVESGLELDWLATGPEAMLAAESRLAEMAADLRADLVQLHTPALVSAGRYACPVIALLHSCVATWWSAVRDGPMPDDFTWRTALVRQGLRHATLAIAPSASFAEQARRIYDTPLLAVHNGRAFPVRQRVPQDSVFTAGRLWDEGKNLHILDEAAARIAVPFKAAGPLSAPDGSTMSFRALQPLGMIDATALAHHLGSQPLFASAALYEPFGLAVLEAAQAGCALLLSDIPTFRELWDGAAIFIDARDANGFADAMEKMLGDAAARLDAGQRARERARRYTPAAMAACMAAHYAVVQRRAAA